MATYSVQSLPTPSSPCDHAPPVVGHEGAGGVAEGWDQLHYVLPQEINLVVLLVGGTLRITITSESDKREREREEERAIEDEEERERRRKDGKKWLCMGTLRNYRTEFTSYLWQLHDSPCRTHVAGSARKTRTGAEERDTLTEHNNALNGDCTSGNP